MTTSKKSYKELKDELNKPVSDFISKYCFWAFGREQLNEKLNELGITEKQMQEQYCGFYGGGAIRKDKVKEYAQLSNEATEKLLNAIKADFELAKDAFTYELNNHECFYTGDYALAISAVGFSNEEYNASELLKSAFKAAKSEYYTWACDNC